MKTENAVLVLVLAAAPLLMCGCNTPGTPQDTVTITYEQVGSCNGYQQTTGPGGSGPQTMVSPGPNAAFATFRVVTIDNSKSSQDFNFEPTRLFINQTPKAFMSSSLSLTRDLGVFAAVPVTVAKGKSQGNNGITVTVVPTVAANGASEANNTSYFLLYDTPTPSLGVVLVKKNPSQTSWAQTDNCLAIQF